MIGNAITIGILLESARILEVCGWTKYALARDARGRSCSISSSNAVSYCLGGALIKAWRALDWDNEDLYHKFFQKKFSEVLQEKYKYRFTYTRWNDSVAGSKEEVVKLIHNVIEAMILDQSPLDCPEIKLNELGASPRGRFGCKFNKGRGFRRK